MVRVGIPVVILQRLDTILNRIPKDKTGLLTDCLAQNVL